jgi:hypothetical protein
LRFGRVLEGFGVEFWDLIDYPQIPPRHDDFTYTVIGNDRIDSLAFRFYEDAALWWVIAIANNKEILPTELNVGESLRIPAPSFVRQSLFKNAGRRR